MLNRWLSCRSFVCLWRALMRCVPGALFLVGPALCADAAGTWGVPVPRTDRYVFLTNASPADSADPRPRVSSAVRGEFLVRFKPEVAKTRQQEMLGPWAAQVRYLGSPRGRAGGGPAARVAARRSVFDQLALVRMAPGSDLNQALAHFRRQPEVLYAEPNYRVQIADGAPASLTPNDFDFSQLWGMHNVGQADGTPGADIHGPEAWGYTTGSSNVIVAIVDTGIDYYHPDLAQNIWQNSGETEGNGLDDDGNGYIDDVHGYDFVSDDSDPMDDLGHGTHVSGTIGAVGNNQAGVAGVCWNVRLMAVKVFDETGNGDVETSIEGIRYAIENGARIINASWGTYDKSQALQDVVDEAYQAGVLFVAAAGNDNSANPFYPAAYPHAVAVAASTDKDLRARFSNYGSYVAVAAPGENIYSTIPNNSYEFYSGTSMATPHVSGTAALILSRHPEFTPDQLLAILRNSVDLIKADQPIGTGRINAAKAVQVETPLPEVKLVLPGQISGNVDIAGTANGNGFVHYTLEYGQGTDPTNWTAFYNSSTPVTSGTLFSSFATPMLGEGPCTFRLTAENSAGEQASERAVVEVSNVHISFPMDEDVLRAGDPIAIRGMVFGGGRHYTVQYGTGADPSSWSSAGVALTDGGEHEVTDGVLATWDTSQVASNQFYTVKLTATASDGTTNEYRSRLIYLDSHLRAGWPQYIPIVGDYPLEDWRDFKVADLDQDGHDEIILVDHGNSDGQVARLLVYHDDGTLWWSKDLAAGEPYSDIPVVGDIDGDGRMEVFVDVGNPAQLFGFHCDGTPLGGNWPIHLEAAGLGKVVADLAGDGKKELIGYSNETVTRGAADYQQLVVFDAQGNLLRRWEVPACSSPVDAPKMFPAVGNLDSEPDLEIVAVSGCGQVSAFKLSKPDGPLWTASTYGTLVASPVVGDLNHDGTNEVVISAWAQDATQSGGVYVFDHAGKRRPGWPVLLDQSFSATPALADFEGDGQLEISIPCWKTGLFHLLRRDGFEATGWPVGPLINSEIRSSAVIGDVDGDGRPDVVLPCPGYMSLVLSGGDLTQAGGVKAWNYAGQPIPFTGTPGIPALVMESSGGTWLKAPPVVLADLDHNGKLEIVAASIQDRTYLPLGQKSARKNRSSLYVWDLNAPYAADAMPWPTFQRDPQNTGYSPTPKHRDQSPVAHPIPNQIVRSGTPFFPIHLDEYVTDPDNSLGSLSWSVMGGVQLTVTIDSNRVATVQAPAGGWTGSETLRFTVADPAGETSSVAASFEARVNYLAPVAGRDSVSTLEDTPVEIDVLANDSDPAGQTLSIAGLSAPRLGTVTLTDHGTVFYTPGRDLNGADSFTYILTDGQGGMAMGEVAIEVVPVNDPPVANPDRVVTDEDVPVQIDVLANDTDPDNDLIRLVGFTPPAHGRVTLLPNQQLLYLSETNYNGTDSFTYTIADPLGATNTGTVSLIIEPVNDPPVAQDQHFSLNRNSSQNITFQAVDPDDTQFTFTVVQSPQHGTLWSYPNVATYYPTNGYVGPDSFTYRANDGKVDGPVATVSLTVLDVNNPPDAEDEVVVTKVGQPVAVHLSATDLDSDPMTFLLVTQPGHGTLSGSGTNYVYTPQAGYLGKDSFAYQAFDGRDHSRNATVNITVTDQNTPPVANDFSVRVLPNTPTNITLQATDPEANPLTFQIVSKPMNGKLTGKGTNILYSPNASFEGSDRFTYRASDGELDSNLATVSLDVEGLNHAPVSTNQDVVVFRNTPATIRLAVTDADGDVLKCPILKGPKNGRLNGLGTNLTYTPKPDFVGADSFTYKAWDGHTYSLEAKVSLAVQLSPPAQSLSFQNVELLSDGQVRLELQASGLESVQVLVSTNLVDWVPLQAPAASSGTISIVDRNAVGAVQRFYRAQSKP